MKAGTRVLFRHYGVLVIGTVQPHNHELPWHDGCPVKIESGRDRDIHWNVAADRLTVLEEPRA